MMPIELIIAGLVAGIFGGFFGLGGGIVIIPILVYYFHFSQKFAQGTTLAALVPPIGLLAAFVYWKAGNVDIKAAFFVAAGFLLGGWLGGELVQFLPEAILRRLFALILIAVAVKMLISK